MAEMFVFPGELAKIIDGYTGPRVFKIFIRKLNSLDGKLIAIESDRFLNGTMMPEQNEVIAKYRGLNYSTVVSDELYGRFKSGA